MASLWSETNGNGTATYDGSACQTQGANPGSSTTLAQYDASDSWSKPSGTAANTLAETLSYWGKAGGGPAPTGNLYYAGDSPNAGFCNQAFYQAAPPNIGPTPWSYGGQNLTGVGGPAMSGGSGPVSAAAAYGAEPSMPGLVQLCHGSTSAPTRNPGPDPTSGWSVGNLFPPGTFAHDYVYYLTNPRSMDGDLQTWNNVAYGMIGVGAGAAVGAVAATTATALGAGAVLTGVVSGAAGGAASGAISGIPQGQIGQGALLGAVTGGVIGGGLGLLSNAFGECGQFLGSCFAAGTPLLTPGGSKPIEQFQIGDLVLSAPEHDSEAPVQPRRVLEVFKSFSRLLEIRVGGRLMRTTTEHPFHVQGKGWTKAHLLSPGNLLRSQDGRMTPVESVEETFDDAPVYNLRVAEYHTYFVGAEDWGFSVWAHNACSGTSGNNVASQIGREQHAAYKVGMGLDKEFRLTNGMRADAVDVQNSTVYELKPNNVRAIRRGLAQLAAYKSELEQMYPGTIWSTILDVYKWRPYVSMPRPRWRFRI